MSVTHIDTWNKVRCPACNTVNWICQGDMSDLTACDVLGVRCHACRHEFLLDDQSDAPDDPDYEDGRPAPSPPAEPYDEIRERVAAAAHEAWKERLYYLLGACSNLLPDANGRVCIPDQLVKLWTKQMRESYNQLPDAERETYRVEADRYLSEHAWNVPPERCFISGLSTETTIMDANQILWAQIERMPIEEIRAELERDGIDTQPLKDFVHAKLAQLRAKARKP